MRRRRQHHLIAWTVLWAVVGALFAVGTDANGSTLSIGCGASGCDAVNINAPSGMSCSNGTQIIYQLSVGGQRKIYEWSGGSGGSWGLIQWDCPPCWTGDSLNWYNTHGYAPVTITVYGPQGLMETATVATSAGSGTGTVNFSTSGVPTGCTSVCSSPVNVTAHWDGGAPHAADVVVNIVVGGFLAQVQCDANGCNGGTFPAAQLNTTGSAPYNVGGGVDPGSWAICGVSGSRYRTTVTNKSAWPSSVACGGTVDIALDAHCAQTTPTPSPSASVAPSPSTTPVITPEPSPSSTPLQFGTPPPNAPGTGVTNGGTTMSGITNQDIYNDVKQALDDAGNRDTEYIVPNGGFGFGSDPGGENGSAGNGLQSAVNRFTNDLSGSGDGLMQKVDAIDSLTLPTSIGDKSSWAVTLPVLGNLTIDLSTFDGPVWAFRSLCLAILVVGAWFAMIKIIRSGVA